MVRGLKEIEVLGRNAWTVNGRGIVVDLLQQRLHPWIGRHRGIDLMDEDQREVTLEEISLLLVERLRLGQLEETLMKVALEGGQQVGTHAVGVGATPATACYQRQRNQGESH